MDKMIMAETWAWGTGNNGSKTKEQIIETFNKGYNSGVTIWDTAEVYGMGNSEIILGECIKDKKNIVISTKHRPKDKFQNGEVFNAFNMSCQRLEVNYIDLYWLHMPINMADNFRKMAELYKKVK